MGALLVRRRTGLSPGARVLAAARAGHTGLCLPGPVSTGTRWRRRLDVVLLPGELRVAGGGGIWRYAVDEMVLAVPDPVIRGALRVDLLEGDPLVVPVRRGAGLLVALRRQIADAEWSAVTRGETGRVARPVVRLVRGPQEAPRHDGSMDELTSAIGLLHARRGRPIDRVPAADPVTRRRLAAHRARVEALRADRRTLLALDSVTA